MACFHLRSIITGTFLCLHCFGTLGHMCEQEGEFNLTSVWAKGANVTLTHRSRCTGPTNATCSRRVSVDNHQLAYAIRKNCGHWNVVSVAKRFSDTYKLKKCCSDGGNYIFIRLEILTAKLVNASVNVTIADSFDNTKPEADYFVRIASCDNSSIEQRGLIVSSKDAMYNSEGNFSCLGSVKHALYGDFSTAKRTRCGEHARWEDSDKVGCYYAPSVTLEKMGVPIHACPDDVRAAGDENVTFACNVTNGFPIETEAELCISEDCFEAKEGTFNETIPMKPEYNGQPIRCNASTTYTRRKSIPVNSKQCLLSIFFGPYKASVSASCTGGDNGTTFSGSLLVDFFSNPPCAELEFMGTNSYIFVDKMKDEESGASCCNVNRQYFRYNFSDANGQELVEFKCANRSALNYSKRNLSSLCKYRPESTPTEQLSTKLIYSTLKTELVATTPNNSDERGTNTIHPVKTESDVTTLGLALPLASLAGIAAGAAVFLLLCIALLVWLMVKRKKKRGSMLGTSSANPAFSESSVPGHGEDSEKQECSNVLYGTANDLKSGNANGGNSREEVDNVLYGTTSSPNSSKVTEGSNQSAEVYTTVQKVKKRKEKGSEDHEASTSALVIDDTYAEVNKVKKKKKRPNKAGKGRENPALSGDIQEDVTYASVDKKQKGKGVKGKKTAGEPGTSAGIEEATYAAIKKKPKKDGSDDDDLHGSNVK